MLHHKHMQIIPDHQYKSKERKVSQTALPQSLTTIGNFLGSSLVARQEKGVAAHLTSGGTWIFRCSYAASRLALAGTQPRLLEMRHTCVSTGNSSRARQNISTHATVFFPTPLNLDTWDQYRVLQENPSTSLIIQTVYPELSSSSRHKMRQSPLLITWTALL